MIRLSKKFIRRGITGLALLAPLVYLFGSQFFALAGAHGEEVFAEPIYVDGEVVSDSFNDNTNKIVLDSDDSKRAWVFQVSTSNNAPAGTSVIFNGSSGQFTYGNWSSTSRSLYIRIGSNYNQLSNYNPETGVISLTNQSPEWIFEGLNFNLRVITYGYDGFTCYESALIPSYTVPENAGAYTSYLFSNMFGNSNFLTSWGIDAISDNPHGFAPFGNMLQFVDENMLHLSDLQIGLMGYGYFYYCAHVLLFVCFFDLTTFFLSWILRITHKFGGADYED